MFKLVYGIELPNELYDYTVSIIYDIIKKYDNIAFFQRENDIIMFGIIYKNIESIYKIDTVNMNKFTDEFMSKNGDNVTIFKNLFKKIKEISDNNNIDITLPDNLDFSWYVVEQ